MYWVQHLFHLQIGENVTYDCIDINMQSGLDHPLLKNHTIQVHGFKNWSPTYIFLSNVISTLLYLHLFECLFFFFWKMKPSVSRTESKSQIGINRVQKQIIPCPDGTIPVWRNTKEYITKAQDLADKHVHPLSDDSPGTHVTHSISS